MTQSSNQFQRPPEIEELSELSWKRIEQQTFRSLDGGIMGPEISTSTRSNRPYIVGALVACAAAALLFAVIPGDGATRQHQASSVTQRSRVVTQSTGSDVIVGDASIAVAPQSAIWIDSLGDSITLTLDEGSVRLKVAPRNERAPVTVLAGKVRVEVVGTEFAVFRSQEEVQVAVFEGVVSVIADGKRRAVSAGEEWPEGEKIAESVSRRSERRHKKRKSDKKARMDKSPVVEVVASPRELYEQAAGLESSAPEAAIALYREVAAGSGPWAANALYAHSRLELSRGKGAAARKLLQRYLSKYPKGPNAQDAQELLDSESASQ